MKPALSLGLFALPYLQLVACSSLKFQAIADDFGKVSHDVGDSSRVEESKAALHRTMAPPVTSESAYDAQHGTNEGEAETIGRKLGRSKPISEPPKSLAHRAAKFSKNIISKKIPNLYRRLGKFEIIQEYFSEIRKFEKEFHSFMSAQGRVPVLQEAFEKLIDPAMDPSMREKWAKSFAKIMVAQKDDLMERALEVEMQVQLLDLELYAKRISATTSQSWDGLIAFTNLRERLADRLEHKVQILDREPWLDYRLDNVLLFARDRMKDIVEDPAVVFEENILLKEHYGKLTSTDSTDDEFKTIWHQVAELGKSTNTETLTRQKVAAVCLLCYVFEVATQDGPEGPQAIRAVKEMKAIVNNDNFQNDFIKPLWSRLSFELKDCQARWLQRKSSEGSSASLGDPHLH